MSVGIVDTSVLCNLLDVPGRDQESARAKAELKAHVQDGVDLLLPLAVVYETGNHIAHATGDRRAAAQRFARLVRQALDGKAPFAPARLNNVDEIAAWLDDFPDQAARQIGIADLSIIALFESQRLRQRHRRVFIWAYDGHLSGYDHTP